MKAKDAEWPSEIDGQRVMEGKKGAGAKKINEICRSNSNCVFARPLAGCRVVPRSIGLVNVRDFGHQRIVRVGICEHRADGKQHCEGVNDVRI